jgi:hypothetical protein
MKHIDVLVAVVVIGLVTQAMASAAGIQLSPSWSALFPAPNWEVATLSVIPEVLPTPKAEPWCASSSIVGGFCVVR